METNKTEKPIFPESDEAAKFVTGISGWMDRHGMFWGKDEKMSRFAGATNKRCGGCQAVIAINTSICSECSRKASSARYLELPKEKWDGETPLYSNTADEFFYSAIEIIEYLADNECTSESLELVICEPQQLSYVDTDHWHDDLPEDGELPDNVQAAVDALNKAIDEAGTVSWSPGDVAAIVDLDTPFK